MLTDLQRVAFFRLARAAYARVSPGIPFDAWRKDEMRSARLPDSVALVDHVEGYDRLMLHFAVLALDFALIERFTAAAERRLRWVLDGLCRDLEFLQSSAVDHEYVEGIYRQAGMQPREFADAPAPRLWEVVQILDTHIRRLADRNDIPRHALPTAGEPWHFRGKRAALFAAVLAHRPLPKTVADQSQQAPSRLPTVAI
jgi:hypothetical protein